MNIRTIELAWWCSCELIASIVFSKLTSILHHGTVEVSLAWRLWSDIYQCGLLRQS